MASLREKLNNLWQNIRAPREDETGKYPVDPDTNRIGLPSSIRSQLREDIKNGYKRDAILRVTKVTGTSREEATDYIDKMERAMGRRRYR